MNRPTILGIGGAYRGLVVMRFGKNHLLTGGQFRFKTYSQTNTKSDVTA